MITASMSVRIEKRHLMVINFRALLQKAQFVLQEKNSTVVL